MILIFLIALDLFMAGAAFYVDFKEFLIVPWYLWIFTPICPIYPLLIALNLIIYKKRGGFFQPLLHFTLIGALSYFIAAFIFYPAYMITHGLKGYEIGNMLWVALYGSQIFLLWPYLKKIPFWWYLIFGAYYLTKDFLDRFSITFSYQREGDLSGFIANFLFATIVLLHLFILGHVAKRPKAAVCKTAIRGFESHRGLQ